MSQKIPPYAPYEPFKPQEPTKISPLANRNYRIYQEETNLKELLDEIGPTNPSEVYFAFDLDVEEVYLTWKQEEAVNEDYEQELKDYEVKLAEYQVKMKQYQKALAKYKKEYRKWLENELKTL